MNENEETQETSGIFPNPTEEIYSRPEAPQATNAMNFLHPYPTPEDNPAPFALKNSTNFAAPTAPPEIRKEQVSLGAVTFAVIFTLVGVAAILLALGVEISLWTLTLCIAGAAGLALLIAALFETKRQKESTPLG